MQRFGIPTAFDNLNWLFLNILFFYTAKLFCKKTEFNHDMISRLGGSPLTPSCYSSLLWSWTRVLLPTHKIWQRWWDIILWIMWDPSCLEILSFPAFRKQEPFQEVSYGTVKDRFCLTPRKRMRQSAQRPVSYWILHQPSGLRSRSFLSLTSVDALLHPMRPWSRGPSQVRPVCWCTEWSC